MLFCRCRCGTSRYTLDEGPSSNAAALTSRSSKASSAITSSSCGNKCGCTHPQIVEKKGYVPCACLLCHCLSRCSSLCPCALRRTQSLTQGARCCWAKSIASSASPYRITESGVAPNELPPHSVSPLKATACVQSSRM